LHEQELLADTIRRAGSPLPQRERISESVLAVAFAGAVLLIWTAYPPHAFPVTPAVLYRAAAQVK